VLGQGGTLGGSRAQTVSGTACISAVVFLPEAASVNGAISKITGLRDAHQTQTHCIPPKLRTCALAAV